jgi:hypothetical protein
MATRTLQICPPHPQQLLLVPVMHVRLRIAEREKPALERTACRTDLEISVRLIRSE